MLNADKPDTWPANVVASVEQYNRWFMDFAPKQFHDVREKVEDEVEAALIASQDLSDLSVETLKRNPSVVKVYRMCCRPPIAVDRLSGLAGVPNVLVKTLENDGLPAKMSSSKLNANLAKILSIVTALRDGDLFPWLEEARTATEKERTRASMIVADRLCTAIANPLVRNAQEWRQKKMIEEYLIGKGYQKVKPMTVEDMEPGTFWPGHLVPIQKGRSKVFVPVDVIIRPHEWKHPRLPVMIECKSAGDFANVNKRRKEESDKGVKLRSVYSGDLHYLMFLCGYFGPKFLQHVTDSGIDWVWEHRIEDLDKLIG